MSEKRLIDANELRKKNVWMKMRTGTVYECDTRAVTVSTIDLAPTIDAVEVVHGHWIVDRERMSAECSECGKGLNFSDEMQIDLLERMERYCYYCGAKMDGEREERESE